MLVLRLRVVLPEKFFHGLSCFKLDNCVETPRALVFYYPMMVFELLKGKRLSIPVVMDLSEEEKEALRKLCYPRVATGYAVMVSVPVEDGEVVICASDFGVFIYRA